MSENSFSFGFEAIPKMGLIANINKFTPYQHKPMQIAVTTGIYTGATINQEFFKKYKSI